MDQTNESTPLRRGVCILEKMKRYRVLVVRPRYALMRIASLILAVGLLGGCATGPGYDEQVRHSYRNGMTRDEAHAVLAYASLLSSVSRPPAGWSATDDSNHQANRAAVHFEREHPDTMVRSCEVYWVGRHTSVPLAVGGVWWDYLFFDSQDKLLGYHRRFLD